MTITDFDDGEWFLLLIGLLLSVFLAAHTRSSSLHSLFIRANPALGISRLSIPICLLWIWIVCENFADESVTGIYVLFYLLLGYWMTKLCGQLGAQLFGPRLRIDVFERKNVAAALFISAFTLATGFIFGGSLWGDAGPETDDVGGWWIPVTFFLMGWACLVVSTYLFLQREGVRFSSEIIQNRNQDLALRTGAVVLSTAIILTDAVAGDFLGWRQALLSFGAIAGLHLIHEYFTTRFGERVETPTASKPRSGASKVFESLSYLALAAFAWWLNRTITNFFTSAV